MSSDLFGGLFPTPAPAREEDPATSSSLLAADFTTPDLIGPIATPATAVTDLMSPLSFGGIMLPTLATALTAAPSPARELFGATPALSEEEGIHNNQSKVVFLLGLRPLMRRPYRIMRRRKNKSYHYPCALYNFSIY